MKASVIIEQLQKAGVTGDALVTAFREMEAGNKPTLSGAERTKRWRDNKKKVSAEEESGIAGDAVTGDAVTVTTSHHHIERDTSLLPLSEDSEKKEVIGVARGRKRKPKTLLSDDWSPVIDLSGPDAPEILRQVERMRNWAKGDGVLKSDWDATWRNWWDRRHDFGGKIGGTIQNRPAQTGAVAPDWQSSRDAWRTARAQLKQHIADVDGGQGNGGQVVRFAAAAGRERSPSVHDGGSGDFGELPRGGPGSDNSSG